MRIVCLLLCFMFLFGQNTVSAAIITKADTFTLTVVAEPPNGFNREIIVEYQEVGVDGWVHEFKLNSANGYCVQRRLEEGNYQCVRRSAASAIISSPESFNLNREQELLVSVVDERDSSQVTVAETVELTEPEEINYDWVKPVLGIFVFVSILAVILVLIKKK